MSASQPPPPPHSVAIFAQVRRLSHGVFGGLGGVVASHLLEASRSPDLFGQEFVCCFGMSPAGDNFSVGMFQFVPSLLVYTQFDDFGNSPENSLVQPDGYNLSVGEFKYVPSLLTCRNPVDLMVHFLDMMMLAALASCLYFCSCVSVGLRRRFSHGVLEIVVVSRVSLRWVLHKAYGESKVRGKKKETVFTDLPHSVSLRHPFLL